jgi:hypothetical protein
MPQAGVKGLVKLDMQQQHAGCTGGVTIRH